MGRPWKRRGGACRERTAAKVLEKTKAASARFHQVTGVALGGSFAKETWLPESRHRRVREDSGRDQRTEFESIGLRVGREAARGYKHGKKYAQHPYTEALIDGVKVNIVPCYDVPMGAWKSAADRSLYHVAFVERNLDEHKRLQVRLLKRFMQAVGVYGAEIEKEGFSGYAVEVLVHRHGDFEGVLRFFADWMRRHRRRESEEERGAKDEGRPPRRRRAGGGGTRRTTRRCSASRTRSTRGGSWPPRSRTRPSQGWSSRRGCSWPGRTSSSSSRRGVRRRVRRALRGRVYVIRFDHRPLSEDTLWGELKKSTRQVVKYVEQHGFSIARAIAASDDVGRSATILLPEADLLPEMEERVGPGVELAAEVRRFISKNKDRVELVWAGEDGRVHLLQRRKYTELARLLEGLIQREIAGIGASREVSMAIRKTGKLIRTPGKINRAADEEEWLGRGIDEIVSDTIGTDSGR